ncbi:MAG: hypothetical protein ACUVRV_13130 [Cyanobacteriota bacterium]
MQNENRFDQIDFRLDRLVGAVLTLTETVSFLKDELMDLRGAFEQQLVLAQEHRSWLNEMKQICQQQSETAHRQAETLDRIITHFLSFESPKS